MAGFLGNRLKLGARKVNASSRKRAGFSGVGRTLGPIEIFNGGRGPAAPKRKPTAAAPRGGGMTHMGSGIGKAKPGKTMRPNMSVGGGVGYGRVSNAVRKGGRAPGRRAGGR